MASLYTMALVQRRDITSLRDLKKRHVPWLKRLQANIIKGVCAKYPSVEPDQLKLYIHCKSPPSPPNQTTANRIQTNPPTTTFTSTPCR